MYFALFWLYIGLPSGSVKPVEVGSPKFIAEICAEFVFNLIYASLPELQPRVVSRTIQLFVTSVLLNIINLGRNPTSEIVLLDPFPV